MELNNPTRRARLKLKTRCINNAHTACANLTHEYLEGIDAGQFAVLSTPKRQTLPLLPADTTVAA